jgi:hypothetical protein
MRAGVETAEPARVREQSWGARRPLNLKVQKG